MLHHISFAVSDLARSARFYDSLLAALGYVRVETTPSFVGYGAPGAGDAFPIKQRQATPSVPGAGFHLAFGAASRAQVDAAHVAGIVHGGCDNGPPGLRPHYGPDYYAAFLIDPDGYAIEVICKWRP